MKKALAAALLVLHLAPPADNAPGILAAQEAAAPPKAAPAQEDFAQALLNIADLEQDTQFNEAIVQCDLALAAFAGSAQQAVLARAAARLRREREKANELSFAIRSLADGKEHKLEEARETLRSAGEVGRVFLRKAVREGDEGTFREAGAVLVEMGDKTIPDIFVERWRHHHTGTMAPAVLDFIEKTKADLGYDHLARLCESAAARPEVLSIVLDVLEESVTLPASKEGDKQPLPELDRLAERMDPDRQSVFAKTLLAYVEKRPDPKPEETSTVTRAENVLVESGFAEVPGLLVREMARYRTGPVVGRLMHLLKRVPDRSLDNGALRELIARAAVDTDNETLAVEIVLDWLDAVAALPPPSQRKDAEVAAALGRLPARVDMDLQSAITGLLVSFVEKRAPALTGAQEIPAQEKAVVERAERILVLGRFPQVPGLLVSRVRETKSLAVRACLIGILKQMPDALDAAALKQLIAHAAKENEDRRTAVDLVMDALECVAAVGAGDRRLGKKAPFKMAILPSRLDDETKKSAAATLIDYLEKEAARELKDEEKKTVARAEKVLLECGLPQVPRVLVARLRSNPKAAVPEVHARLLGQMAGRLDKECLRELAACVVENNVNRCTAVRVFMDSLEGSAVVVRHDGSPDRGRPPALEKLPTRLDDDMHDVVLNTLIAFVESPVAPLRKDAPESSEAEKKEVERAERILVQSRFRNTPAVLVSKLTQARSGEFKESLVRLLAQMKEPVAKMEGHHRSTLVTALIAFLEERAKPNATPQEKTAVEQAEKVLIEGRLPEAPILLVQKLKSSPTKPFAVPVVVLLERMKPDVDRLDANNQKALTEGLIAFLQSRGTGPKAGDKQKDIERAEKLLRESKYDQIFILLADKLTGHPPPSAELADRLVGFLEPLRGSLARLDAGRRANLVRSLIEFIGQRAVPNATGEQKAALERAERTLLESRLPEAATVLVQKLKSSPATPIASPVVVLLERMKPDVDKLDANNQKALTEGLIAFLQSRVTGQKAGDRQQDIERAERMLLGIKYEQVHSLFVDRLTGRPAPSAEFADRLVALLEARRASLAGLDSGRRTALAKSLITYMGKREAPNATGEQKAAADKAEKILAESKLPEAPRCLVEGMKTCASDGGEYRLVRLLEREKGGLAKLDANSRTLLIRGLLKIMDKRSVPNATAPQKESADRAERLLSELKLDTTLSPVMQSLRKATGPFAERLARIVKRLQDKVDEKTYKQIKSLASKEGPDKALLADLVKHLAPKFPDKR